MFKRILVLFVLFAVISCKQNPSTILSSPPTEDNGITDGSNTDSGNTDNGNTDNGNTDNGSGYGYYNVYILGNNGTNEKISLRISDSDKMLTIYSNMILNTNGSPKFKLSKKNITLQYAEKTVTESYTFDSNLDIKNAEGTIAKKFRGVCIVRIYPDAAKTANSSLLGDYTIAGVYTEIENTSQVNTRAMKKTDKFQNYGYDELIILRPDIIVNIQSSTTGYANTAEANYTNYRADILFNNNKSIDLYYYNPNRTFKNQNTNYIFERIEIKTK